MKNIYRCVLVALMGLALGACSESEDTTPSHIDENGFAPSDADGSAEASLRRDFYDQTGVYLLFNDTLSVRQTGMDSYGNPIYDVKLVDIDYNMTGSSIDYYRYTYDYIQDEALMRKAALLLQEKLLSRLGTMCPYSVLLANEISQWTQNSSGEWVLTKEDSYYGTSPHPLYRLGTRCYAFSLNHGAAFEDPHYFDNMLSAIVIDKIGVKGDDFLADFRAVVENYDNLTDDWTDKEELGYELGRNIELAHQLGFLTDNRYYYFPSVEIDRNDYVKAVFTYTDSEFEEQFGQYPYCMEKFKIMKRLILSLGVKLND